MEDLKEQWNLTIRNPDRCLHLDLDGALPREDAFRAGYFDARQWGPKLRFSASKSLVETFYREVRDHLGAFTLYGSGDFHYLTALWLRRFQEPFVLVCFDNHPDWDIRPPHWSCGGWMNRALELENLQTAAVWGCGNFELRWPHLIFGNKADVRKGRLQIFPWVERHQPRGKNPWATISRSSWREQFEAFVEKYRGRKIYITIDMDCLNPMEAVTNWENGLFTVEDLVWALSMMRSKNKIIGGDLCGAYSPPCYARWKQRFASEFDHPKIPVVDEREAQEVNRRVCEEIFPVLTA